MIKINLLNSFGDNQSSEVLQQIDEKKKAQQSFAIKSLLIIVGPLVLFAYENYNIPLLKQKQAEINQKIAEITTFNQKGANLKSEIEKYEKDLARLNKQTAFLDRIQRERALPVMLLSQMTQVMPPNVWMTALKVDQSNIEIRGESDSERDINQFNIALSAVPFIKDLTMLSIEVKNGGPALQMPIKAFQMKAAFSPQFFEQNFLQGNGSQPTNLEKPIQRNGN